MKTNERTLQMKQNFMQLYNEGMTAREIAEKFNLNPQTAYNHLGDIAREAGVSRESLLERPHGDHVCYERQFMPVEPVDLTKFHEHFEASMQEIEEVRTTMKAEIKKQEKIAQRMEQEEATWQK